MVINQMQCKNAMLTQPLWYQTPLKLTILSVRSKQLEGTHQGHGDVMQPHDMVDLFLKTRTTQSVFGPLIPQQFAC